MNRYLLATQARDDLDQIWNYLKEKSDAAADRQLEMLLERFAILASQPLLGELREDLRPGLRIFSANMFVILYYPLSDGIEVVGVLHGARDIEGIYRRGER